MTASTEKCSCEVSEEELLATLDDRLEAYKGMPGGLIPALHVAQGLFGYIPRSVIRHVSEALDIPMSEVYGVVSFYHFFTTEPRGKHTVSVCLGTACYVRGGKRVLEAFKQKLGIDVGATTPDGQFTLEVARCFGACGLAPAVRVDEDVHRRVKPTKIGAILEQYAEEITEPEEAAV